MVALTHLAAVVFPMPLFSERPTRIESGKQVIVAEADDILCIRVQGYLTGTEARWAQSAMFDYGTLFGPYDIVVDIGNLLGFDSEARQIWVHATKPYQIRSLYAVNGSFAAKTLLWGIYRAGRVLQPAYFDFTFETFTTEAEARALIQTRRSAAKTSTA
jgi:hypothetical protein